MNQMYFWKFWEEANYLSPKVKIQKKVPNEQGNQMLALGLSSHTHREERLDGQVGV
jgi:hypothetical protein